MNICDSNRPMRRMLRVLGQVTSATTLGRFSSSARELPSFHALSCWALIVTVLLFMISGCGKYKEELDSAKQQIENQNAEIKKLTETAARLKQEKRLLSDESKTLSDKNTRMQRELGELIKTKAALSAENKEMRKKNTAAEEEIASLKLERTQLAQEVQDLKKQVAEMAAPSKSPAAMPTEGGPQSASSPEDVSPCDAIIAYMRACEEVVRQQTGAERTDSLELVKQQFAPRMKGAPEKAITAAENWVKEGTKFWDQPADDSTFRLLQLRNIVLEACGKSPSGADFK